MHVFLDPAASEGERKIRKARAEEFIHIFVHQKAKLIEFLEHMVQVIYHFSFSCFIAEWGRKIRLARNIERCHEILDLVKIARRARKMSHDFRKTVTKFMVKTSSKAKSTSHNSIVKFARQ